MSSLALSRPPAQKGRLRVAYAARHLTNNQLLDALSPEAYGRLSPYLESAPLAARQVLYECEETISYVYFPTGAALSLLSLLEDGSAIEVGVIGSEGMAGVSVVLGSNWSANRVITQFPGTSLRARVEAVKAEFGRGGEFQRLLLGYTNSLLNLICQTSACSRRHSVEERFSRWLLMVHDRTRAIDFPLTQDFIAQLLGTRRASITMIATALQKAKAIRYTRGRIRILDRQTLEATACECYRLIKQELDGGCQSRRAPGQVIAC